MPTKSLFMYDGYPKDCVLAAVTVDTNWLVWSKDGVWTCNLSAHIWARALLSKTTTESAWSTSRFSVSNDGCMTTSPSWVFGNTPYVWWFFFGNLSFNRSKIKNRGQIRFLHLWSVRRRKPSEYGDVRVLENLKLESWDDVKMSTNNGRRIGDYRSPANLETSLRWNKEEYISIPCSPLFAEYDPGRRRQ